MSEFKDMPALSEKAKEYMASGFTPYLFFKILKPGIREYTCTSCGKTFKEGEKILMRTVTPEDVALKHAKHNDTAICPHCGKEATVKNIKIKPAEGFGEYRFVCIMTANSYSDVWIRCFEHKKEYENKLSGTTKFTEFMRYRLRPGSAEFWVNYGSCWLKKDRPGEAFLWNHGYYNEKYEYSCFSDGISIDETFLKYNSCYLYEGAHGYNLPYIKYLCWYAIHPQIEMLAKLGHFKTIDEMILGNNDLKSILDWNAKTPWGLYRLPKQIYSYWRERFFGDMGLLRIYSALGGSSIKDFGTAQTVLNFSHGKLKEAKKLISLSKKLKITVKQIIKYCSKVSERSAGCCHCCPGITSVEAYQMWRDYLVMADRAGLSGKVSVFPSDLKSAHDSFATAEQLAKASADAKALKAAAEKEAAEVAKRFPKIETIYKQIKDKYSYTNGKYSVIVPETLEELVINNTVLRLCMNRNDRYYERISIRESYIFFLRFADKPQTPWYTLEAEPSGTLRQKRGVGDEQRKDLEDAMPFLIEWQKEVAKRLDRSDRRLAGRSKVLRNEHFDELRQTGKTINYGDLRGQRLIDVLERDLMEAETA